MIEDDYYRTSTQYRYWSYTAPELAHLRQTTNDLASTRVRHAIQRANGSSASTTPILTLTVTEELQIITWGCQKIHEIGLALKPHAIPSEHTINHELGWNHLQLYPSCEDESL